MTTPQDLLSKRADMAVADLSSGGGLLSPTQLKPFLDELYNATPILSLSTQVTMPAATHEISRVGFGSRILKAGTADNTELASNKREKPITHKTTLNAKKWNGEVWIPWTVLEDNIEKDGFQTRVLSHIAQQCGIDISSQALNCDTAIAVVDDETEALAVTDGWLKLATAHIIDAGGANIDADLFHKWYKGMPAKYLDRNAAPYRFFPSRDVALDWRKQMSARATILGDKTLIEEAVPSYSGRPVIGDVNIRGTTLNAVAVNPGLFCDPANLVVGVHREIRINPMNWPPAEAIRVFVSIRAAFNFFQPDAIVRMDNIAPTI